MKGLVKLLSLFATALLMIACSGNYVPEKVYQVGIVSLNFQADNVLKGFMQGLEKKEYLKGKNIDYIYPGPLKKVDEAKELIQELIDKKVDLIYTITTPATKAAMKLTEGTDIPILFGPMMSPIKAGLVKELYSPDNTVTGVRVRGSTEKALAYLMEIKPNLKAVFVPFHVNNGPAKVSVSDLKKAAKKLGVTVLTKNVSNAQELLAAMNNIPSQAGAVWVTHSHLIVANVVKIAEIANQSNIPVASPVNQLSKGVLVTYSAQHEAIGEQVSRLADKLLRGVKPQSLPIETAEFFLGINLKVADQLGLEVPSYLKDQADYIAH